MAYEDPIEAALRSLTGVPLILKAVKATGAEVKPHRRKWQS